VDGRARSADDVHRIARGELDDRGLPPQDFTVSLRAAVWTAAEFAPEQAASACSSRRAALGPASYASRAEWLGVSYAIEGTFARLGAQQMIQIEAVAPDRHSAFARALLAAWTRIVSSVPRP
jgi:hypothetical protein